MTRIVLENTNIDFGTGETMKSVGSVDVVAQGSSNEIVKSADELSSSRSEDLSDVGVAN